MSSEFEVLGAGAQAEAEAFSRWVVESDAVQGARCLVALDTLHRLFEDSSPFALAAKRDAALVLVQTAQAGGFSSAAAFFQSCYDAWCRALLPYQGWLS